ncbi:MAG: hypothetical protein WKF78_11970 [Candidatus Limnocylindrales bacterium]
MEDLDPAEQGDLFSPKKLLGLVPFGAGDKLARLLRQVPLQPAPDRRHHHRALPRTGRAPARQRGDRAGEGQPVGRDGSAAPVRVPRG